jgi:hypothetical protein
MCSINDLGLIGTISDEEADTPHLDELDSDDEVRVRDLLASAIFLYYRSTVCVFVRVYSVFRTRQFAV